MAVMEKSFKDHRVFFLILIFCMLMIYLPACAVMGLQQNALITAVRDGDVAKAEAVLEKDPDVNNVTKDQRFALMAAASNGYPEIAGLLVEKGADVNLANEDGMTALMAAAANGHESVARFLIEHGADLSKKNKRGFSALHFAVDGGSAGLVQLFVENGSVINVSGEQDVPPLFIAVEKGHKEAAEILMENGAELNVTNPDGSAPLHAAAKRANYELVKLLVEAGADIYAKNGQGADALLVAAGSDYYRIVENLYDRIGDSVDSKKPKDLAGELEQRYNLYNLLRELEGISPEYSSSDTIKDYYRAVDNSTLAIEISGDKFQSMTEKLRQDYLDIANLLLDAGVNVDTSDRRGQTVIMKLCKQKGCVLEEFEEKSIELAPDVASRLNSACGVAERIHAELMVLFMKKGADVAARDENAQTALMHACENENFQYAKFLIRHGADVNKANSDGWTPLIYAVANEDFEMASLLIEKGANVNARNSFGETALLKAVHRNNVEIVELLMKNGADPDIENFHHSSPRNVAKEYGYSKILKLLRL